VSTTFVDTLSPIEIVALLHMPEFWLRPEQKIPDYPWRVWATICGRGFGKTKMNAAWVTGRVQTHGTETTRVILMAPNEHRVRDIQVSALLQEAPPWFPAEEYKEGVRWPNGARAIPFTPEAPEKTRSENASIAWLTEIVDWNLRNAMAAWRSLSTATRIRLGGQTPQIVVDTTSKPGNPLIAHLVELNAADPRTYRIQGGTMYDNPKYDREYLRSEYLKYGGTGRLYREEIMGEIFSEAAGALFTQARLNANRLERPRDRYDMKLVGLDPGGMRPDSDATGIIIAGRAGRDVDVLDDRSGKHSTDTWASMALGACIDEGCAGIVIETNHGPGDTLVDALRARAQNRGVSTRVLTDKDKAPFPARTPKVIYVRAVHARESKFSRAEGPAALDEAGRLHMIGTFPELETELVTFEPGVSKSPNRYDAMNHVVAELANLRRDMPEKRPGVSANTADDMRKRLRSFGSRARVL
jgi:phage terminase large subunit-like protein